MGAPSTRVGQKIWIGQFNAFRQCTLNQSRDRPFGGDDVLRFFDSINKICPGSLNKPAHWGFLNFRVSAFLTLEVMQPHEIM